MRVSNKVLVERNRPVTSRFLHRAAELMFPPTGVHRRPPLPLFPPAPVVAVVAQAFRFCPRCEVETAAIVHRDGSFTCTEDHRIAEGDPT